jgi:hypothetical protein
MKYRTTAKTPSVELMMSELGINEQKAQAINDVFTGNTDIENVYPEQSRTTVLYAINEILETKGVEYVPHKDDKYFHTDQLRGLEYCNTGDIWDNTVLFDYDAWCWKVDSVFKIVEFKNSKEKTLLLSLVRTDKPKRIISSEETLLRYNQ